MRSDSEARGVREYRIKSNLQAHLSVSSYSSRVPPCFSSMAIQIPNTMPRGRLCNPAKHPLPWSGSSIGGGVVMQETGWWKFMCEHIGQSDRPILCLAICYWAALGINSHSVIPRWHHMRLCSLTAQRPTTCMLQGIARCSFAVRLLRPDGRKECSPDSINGTLGSRTQRRPCIVHISERCITTSY